jgi:hypothetical protein
VFLASAIFVLAASIVAASLLRMPAHKPQTA